MSVRRIFIFLAVSLSISLESSLGQSTDQLLDSGVAQDWFLRDPESGKFEGTSTEKAYETLLKGKPSRKVRVAVIDSGIDVEHEDLSGIIWTNSGEIPNNGIDDDKNGYIDDIHGWNFIGGKDSSVNRDTYELTREYVRLKPRFESGNEKKIKKKDKADYALWQTVKPAFDKEVATNKEQFELFSQQYDLYQQGLGTLTFCDSILRTRLQIDSISKSSLTQINPSNDTIKFAKETLINVLQNVEGDILFSDFLDELEAYLVQLKEGVEHFQAAVEYGYNPEYNSRIIVGDNPDDPNEKHYGNNDVKGGDAKHGTHVAGIIGANRKNDLGVKGVADNVEIIAIRVVPPNGDERDKDIANGIMYAVDNGAKIINMSFGKDYSPHKEVVDKAVKYAEEKGVILMHGSGNDGENLDTTSQFPTRYYRNKKVARTWMEIGASTWENDSSFVASFSNYGKKTVDLFAPGVEIYSTVPNNEYEGLQGTSMACPIVTGVAALVWSYFPDLTAVQIKDIINQSTRKYNGLKVIQPGTGDTVAFNLLSITGGTVNAYEAVKLAMSYSQSGQK